MHPCHIYSVLSSAAKYKSAQDMCVHPTQDTIAAIFKYKRSQNKQLTGAYKKKKSLRQFGYLAKNPTRKAMTSYRAFDLFQPQ